MPAAIPRERSAGAELPSSPSPTSALREGGMVGALGAGACGLAVPVGPAVGLAVSAAFVGGSPAGSSGFGGASVTFVGGSGSGFGFGGGRSPPPPPAQAIIHSPPSHSEKQYWSAN